MENMNINITGHVETKNDNNNSEKFSDEEFKKIAPGTIVFFGNGEYEELNRHHAGSLITTGGTVLYNDDLTFPFVRKNSQTVRPDIQKNDNFKKITDEEFKKITVDDTIFWGRKNHAKVKEILSDAILMTAGKQVSKIVLTSPFFAKNSINTKQTLGHQTTAPTTAHTPAKKTEKPQPKTKSRLDILIEKNPKHEALIRKEFGTIGVSYDDIEAIVLMEDAAQAAREGGK